MFPCCNEWLLMIYFLLLGFVDDLKTALFDMSHRDIVLEPEVVPVADLLHAPSRAELEKELKAKASAAESSRTQQ